MPQQLPHRRLPWLACKVTRAVAPGADVRPPAPTGRVVAAVMLVAAIGCNTESPAPVTAPAPDRAAATPPPFRLPAASAPRSVGLSAGLKRASRPDGSPDNEKTPVECSQFTNVAAEVGLMHVYVNGAAGQVLMVEATGGGCGWLDYDRDGNWDVYLNQGGDPTATVLDGQPSDQLFRNVGGGRFELATTAAGIDERRYGQGVAVGDFDNDGFDDVYVTNVGGNILYHNAGDGTFQELAAGVAGGLWSTSAAWADLDLDGDLDLYVCNYVDFDPHHPRICHNARGRTAMCHPNQMEPVPDECYLNLGQGEFRPIAAERGLVGPGNKALGVAIADFNNDGFPDVFVANDTTPNFLFVNDGQARFRESAALVGCAVNTNGSPQANMGIAVGDYDRNGWLDLFVTHFTREWNTLYRNRGLEGFQDVSALTGLVPAQLDKLGFGTVMADFNADGFDDLFVANGHVHDNTDQGDDFAMISQLFTWQGRRWQECTDSAGDYFQHKLVTRGVAWADYNNDGGIDLVVVPQNAPVALLNNTSHRGNRLKLEFVGRQSNRRGIGTRVVARFGKQRIMQELAGGTSYCSSHQPALFFGLGDWAGTVELEVRWPGGATQTLTGVAVNRDLVLFEPLGADQPATARR